MSGIQFGSSNDMSNVSTVTFDDVAAPSNPSDGSGILYKKTGTDGLFWRPDSAGSEVNIFKGTESFDWVGVADTDETFTIQPHQSIYMKCDNVSPGGSLTFTPSVALNVVNMSTGVHSVLPAAVTSVSSHMSSNVTSILINTTSTSCTVRVFHPVNTGGPS